MVQSTLLLTFLYILYNFVHSTVLIVHFFVHFGSFEPCTFLYILQKSRAFFVHSRQDWRVVTLYLSIYLSILLSIYLSTYLSINPYNYSSIYFSVLGCVCAAGTMPTARGVASPPLLPPRYQSVTE